MSGARCAACPFEGPYDCKDCGQIRFRCRECGYLGTIDATENAGTDDSMELCPVCSPDCNTNADKPESATQEGK